MTSTTSRVLTLLMRRQAPSSTSSSSSSGRRRLLSSAAVKAGATKSEKFMHLEVSEEWGRGGGAEGGRMGSREEGKGVYYTHTS